MIDRIDVGKQHGSPVNALPVKLSRYQRGQTSVRVKCKYCAHWIACSPQSDVQLVSKLKPISTRRQIGASIGPMCRFAHIGAAIRRLDFFVTLYV